MTILAADLKRKFPSLTRFCSDSELAEITSLVRRKRIPAGKRAVSHGDMAGDLLLVEIGALLVKGQADGKEVPLGCIESGHWVGETSLLFPGPSPLTLESEEGAVVLELRQSDFTKLRSMKPRSAGKLVQALLGDMAKRLRASSAEIWKRPGATARTKASERSPAVWLGKVARKLLNLKRDSR